MPKSAFRLTKIIFTLGPATEDEAMLEKLILAGVDVCRLNMAHADDEWTRTMIRRVRDVCGRTQRHIALLMDVKGPEIRTGDLPEPLELAAGPADRPAAARREGRGGACWRSASTIPRSARTSSRAPRSSSTAASSGSRCSEAPLSA